MGMFYQPIPALRVGRLAPDTTPACGRCGIELDNPRPGEHYCNDCRLTIGWEQFVRDFEVPIMEMHEDDIDILIASSEARKRWRERIRRQRRLEADAEQEQVAA
jgi:hypothetical protein